MSNLIISDHLINFHGIDPAIGLGMMSQPPAVLHDEQHLTCCRHCSAPTTVPSSDFGLLLFQQSHYCAFLPFKTITMKVQYGQSQQRKQKITVFCRCFIGGFWWSQPDIATLAACWQDTKIPAPADRSTTSSVTSAIKVAIPRQTSTHPLAGHGSHRSSPIVFLWV